MSSSGLDWQPILQAWLKTRPTFEVSIIMGLFSSVFPTLLTWSKQNIALCFDLLEVNFIAQVITYFFDISYWILKLIQFSRRVFTKNLKSLN